MDEIMIQNLAVNGVIGIFDWERNIKQKISMDICIGCDISKASISDNIQDAVDYKKISKSIIEFVSKSEFYLIEKFKMSYFIYFRYLWKKTSKRFFYL